MLNELIRKVNEAGIEGYLYRGFYVAGFVVTFIFNTFYASKYKIDKIKSLIFSVLSYVVIFGWSFVLAWVMNGFEWGHHNAIRVYIWFPVLMLLFGKLFRINWRTSCDFIAPSTCIVYGIARLACIFPGCCYGIPCSWGLYSYTANEYVFPVQLFEALTSLVVAGIAILLNRKDSYKSTGKTYPIMLLLYGFTRFIWEFFSAKEKVFLNCTELGIWAFATGMIGVIWLIVFIWKTKKNQTETNKIILEK